MKDFQTIITQLNEQIYTPNDLIVIALQEEPQNAAYGAGAFQIPFVLE